MLFASRVPPKTLAIISRSLATMLESGIQIRKAIEISSKKSMHGPTKKVLGEVADAIQEGTDISTALKQHGHFFPVLFLEMVEMAEESGALPEVLKHLADHYETNIRMKKEFIGSMIWPVFQLVAAIFVIALLILILGVIAESTGNDSMSFLVFGLSGTTGATIWLMGTFGTFAAGYAVWLLIQRAAQAKAIVDPFLLLVPVLGHCMRSFAIARFSWSYYLTQQTGMPVTRSLQGSLKATGNGAFIAQTPFITSDVMEGASLTESLAKSRLFPEEYLEMVSVAEESGTVPEALHRLSPQFEEEARRAMKMLTRMISAVVWLFVAGFIVFFVFRFMLWYVDQIGQALEGT
ncbi:MAG: type II secretion system F family protein [Planctomycetota bacterium]|nr:type II secretion system F family protein [Planctomycetota bacterium]